MRVHSDTLSAMHIVNALNAEKQAGRIAHSVTFKTLEKKGSRTHRNAFEVQLDSYGKEDGDGRRRGNSGSYGTGEDYAATYDEWGFLIQALYALDADAVWGTVKYPVYEGVLDFEEKTGLSYSPRLVEEIGEWGGDPYPYVYGKGGMVGRVGYGRIDESNPYLRTQYAEAVEAYEAGQKQGNKMVKYLPRTAAEVRAFQKRGDK